MLAVVQNPTSLEGDLVRVDGVLMEGLDLETAVRFSLFVNAAAKADDDVPSGMRRQGYWADVLSENGDIMGSRLWLLARRKVTAETLLDAETYAKEALAWMVRGGFAERVQATCERIALDDGATQGGALRVEVWPLDGGESVKLGPWTVLRDGGV